MIPRFALARPRTIDDAFAAFAAADGDGAYIAGGTELLQVMKMGFAQFRTLIDLKGIPELHGIARTADGLRIGATTTHREIERSAEARDEMPALVAMERGVANVRVRSTGTIGGNLAFAEPHSDPATLLLACGATVELVGHGGRRTLSIADFILGPLFTARDPEEIVTAIHIPAAPAGEGRAYGKLAFFERPAASVAVRITVAEGSITDATVAVGSLTEVPEVIDAIGAALVGVAADPAAVATRLDESAAAFDAVDAVDDLNGSPEYKRHLAAVLLGSTGQAALQEALVRA